MDEISETCSNRDSLAKVQNSFTLPAGNSSCALVQKKKERKSFRCQIRAPLCVSHAGLTPLTQRQSIHLGLCTCSEISAFTSVFPNTCGLLRYFSCFSVRNTARSVTGLSWRPNFLSLCLFSFYVFFLFVRAFRISWSGSAYIWHFRVIPLILFQPHCAFRKNHYAHALSGT